MSTTVRSDLTTADRAALLALARGAIAERLGVSRQFSAPRTPAFDAPAAAFVTVFVDRALRGCIGMTDALQPLAVTVRHCAAAAAFEDPRFPPIVREELHVLAIEISVLSPLEALTDLDAVVIGRDGLVVERGFHRGLLLPQVAVEHGWSAVDFVRYTCVKASLPPDAWQDGALLYRFQAEVFGERERMKV